MQLFQVPRIYVREGGGENCSGMNIYGIVRGEYMYGMELFGGEYYSSIVT